MKTYILKDTKYNHLGTIHAESYDFKINLCINFYDKDKNNIVTLQLKFLEEFTMIQDEKYSILVFDKQNL